MISKSDERTELTVSCKITATFARKVLNLKNESRYLIISFYETSFFIRFLLAARVRKIYISSSGFLDNVTAKIELSRQISKVVK